MHLLITLFLLLSQQAVFSHALTHLSGAPASQDQQLPHGKVCDQCVQGAQFGGALLDSSNARCWVGEGAIAVAPDPVCVHLPRPIPAFSSRAPPPLI